MIPQEKSAAVVRGLRKAFGVTEFEDVRRMTKGHTSAHVFRIVVRGRPFLLRIAMYKNLTISPGRQFICMRTAAEAGLAPHVWYTSVEDQISITDFVEEVPFPAAEALVRMPGTLRKLHALPPFPRGVDHLDTSCMFLLHKGSAVDALIQRFKATNTLSQGETEQLLDWHAQLAAAYPRDDADMVSSHNDLFKPDNILFDGRRVWLVDWEAAFLNDRYADLAVVANSVVTNEAEEQLYLQEYLGQAPDEYQVARFFLMQQIVHVFYTIAFLFLGSSGGPVNRPEKIPEFRAFQRRMWEGELNIADTETKIAYGWVHWEQLLQNMRDGRFEGALSIVSERNARVV